MSYQSPNPLNINLLPSHVFNDFDQCSPLKLHNSKNLQYTYLDNGDPL